MLIIEKLKDIRDTSIKRNAFEVQKLADNINVFLQHIDELNHYDYDYISVLLEKCKTMLCVTDYILENYYKNKIAWQAIKLIT